MTVGRLITIEEHYLDPDVGAAVAPTMRAISPGFGAAYDPSTGLPYSPDRETLLDLGERRIADMDAAGVDVQVLSSLTTQMLPADVAPDLVRRANDRLAAAVARHPDRFAGFAALPTSAPDVAPDELRRAVSELGLVGSLVHGRTGDRFLSEPEFESLLAAHAELRVPLYLHPAPPPAVVARTSYAVSDEIVATRLATAGWGWHDETGVHFLHLVLAGVFDRHPDLQVILGHWGEMAPWFAERLDEALPPRATGLQREISDYLRHNAYITPSGMFSKAQLDFVVATLGTDRLVMSIDYPFVTSTTARDFLADSGLDDAAQAAFAHGTAEKLLGL